MAQTTQKTLNTSRQIGYQIKLREALNSPLEKRIAEIEKKIKRA